MAEGVGGAVLHEHTLPPGVRRKGLRAVPCLQVVSIAVYLWVRWNGSSSALADFKCRGAKLSLPRDPHRSQLDLGFFPASPSQQMSCLADCPRGGVFQWKICICS